MYARAMPENGRGEEKNNNKKQKINVYVAAHSATAKPPKTEERT